MLLTIAVVLMIVVVLTATPVSLVFALKKEPEKDWRGRIVVYWLFGHMRTTIRAGSGRKDRRIARKSAALLARHRRRMYALLRSDGFIRRSMSLFKNLIIALQPRRLRLQCTIGLPDPADTGRLMGLIMPIGIFAGKVSFGKRSKLTVQVTPEFSGPCFKGECCASVQFVPLKLFGLFMGFLLSRSVLKAIRASILVKNASTPSQRLS